MLLDELPTELLGFILSADYSSPMTMRLWKCGCKLLNFKLSTSVTRFELRNMRAVFPGALLPRLLLNFHRLRSLRIESRKELVKSLPEWPMLLSNFPVTLEALHIASPDAPFAFLNHTPESTISELRTIKTDYARGPSNLIDMDRLFPRLHTLKIDPPRFDLPPRTPFQLDDFAGLPSQLLHFEAQIFVDASEWSKLALLPASIQYLGELSLKNLRAFNNLPQWPITLLPNLLELRSYDFDRLQSVHWLPRSLTRFDGVAAWSFEIARAWPPLVGELWIGKIDENSFISQHTIWHDELPPSLTKLHIDEDCPNRSERIRLDPLARFPTSLTLLTSRSPIYWITDNETPYASATAMASTWPNLKEIDLSSLAYSPDHWNLPKHLETASLWISRSWQGRSIHDDSDPVDLSFLPASLTTLHTRILCHKYALSGTLPPRLQTLSLNTGFMTRENFNLLPNSITDLKSSCRRLKHELLTSVGWTLPSFLTRLSIKYWHCDGLESLPGSLTSLHIEELGGLDDTPCLNQGSLFEKLPIGLTSLDLAQSPIPNLIPTQRLSHLRSLRSLSTISLCLWESDILRNLPRGLRQLDLRLVRLDEVDAPFLPPNLESVTLGNQIDYATSSIGLYWPLFDPKPPIRLVATIQQRLIDFNN